MTVTLLKRLATIVALVTLSAMLSPVAVAAQSSRPGNTASLADDQTPELQIQRLYGAIFARQPDAEGFAFWVDQLTSGARTLQQIADAMVVVSPEFTQTYGTLDNTGFVEQLYLNVQGRPGEAGGVAFWAGQLDSGARSRGGVVLGFSEGPEYRIATGSADPLERLYCAYFLRNPDAGGRTFWIDQYLVQERSLASISQSFSAAPEFANTYGSLSNRQFVELIYKNVLGRDLPVAETEGPNFWTGQLSTGARTRGEVMVAFSESQEYQNRWTRGAACPSAGRAVPTAVDDNVTVTFNGSELVRWAQNDTLPAGTTVAILTQGARGTASNNGDGTFTYTHNGAAGSSDSFTYRLTSSDGVASTGTVNVSILDPGADGIPTAVDDVFNAQAGVSTELSFLSNDTTDGTVTVASFTQPANGTVTYGGADTFTYTPAAGFDNDTDTFTYTLTDNGDPADTSQALVTVRVGGSDVGGAVNDRFIVVADTAEDLDILANDDTAGLSLGTLSEPSHGTLEVVGDSVRYTPDAGYTAARTDRGLVGDSFTYTLIDAVGNTSQATVEIIVLAKPECEVFMNYPYLSTDGVDGDLANIELFFSNLGCVELYTPASIDVVWSGVTVDGAPVTTTSPDPVNPLRDLAPVGNAAADNDVTVAGTATLVVNGSNAVTIQFQLQFTRAAADQPWNRGIGSYRGRGDGDVTVLINPLTS